MSDNTLRLKCQEFLKYAPTKADTFAVMTTQGGDFKTCAVILAEPASAEKRGEGFSAPPLIWVVLYLVVGLFVVMRALGVREWRNTLLGEGLWFGVLVGWPVAVLVLTWRALRTFFEWYVAEEERDINAVGSTEDATP